MNFNRNHQITFWKCSCSILSYCRQVQCRGLYSLATLPALHKSLWCLLAWQMTEKHCLVLWSHFSQPLWSSAILGYLYFWPFPFPAVPIAHPAINGPRLYCVSYTCTLGSGLSPRDITYFAKARSLSIVQQKKVYEPLSMNTVDLSLTTFALLIWSKCPPTYETI